MRMIDEELEQRVRSNEYTSSRKFPSTIPYSLAKFMRQKGKSVAFAGGGAVLLGAFIMVRVGYTVAWTGFNSSQSSKALWDWLQLLIVPVVLAVGGFMLARKRERAERQTMLENQREALLQTYFDRMTELSFERKPEREGERQKERAGIYESVYESDYEDIEQPAMTQSLAKARTTIALRSLDTARKGLLISFLSDSNMLKKALNNNLSGANLQEISLRQIDLRQVNLQRAKMSGADCSSANLRSAHLEDADFGGAKLRGANLSDAYLSGALLDGADLRGANLSGANLTGAVLDGADLRGANLDGAILDNVTLLKAQFSYRQLEKASSTVGMIQ